MSTKQTAPQIIPFRQGNQQRVYSNHVEINVSEIDLNFKFCDAKPPENSEDVKKIKEDGKLRVPIVSEVVIPIAVARELKRIFNERIKEGE